MQKPNAKPQLLGTWVSSQPFDSDDYLVEYTIAKVGSVYKVTARDYRDGEMMEISHVKFDGHTLEFVSIMPSTGRRGINRFTVKDPTTLVSEFTFTVVETLKRVPVGASPQERNTTAGRTAKHTRQRRKA